ncbi:putative ubiquitin-conjugating enzyme E2 38, partial [Mucuna pruriens]
MSRSIEPPPLLHHSFPSPKRRVYSGGSSSHRLMDPDVIEIPPPTNSVPNLMKQKEAILHDVIDVDNDDDSADLILLGEKVGKADKGKAIESFHDGYGDHHNMEMFDDIFCPSVMDKSGSGDGDSSDNSCDDDDDDYSDLFVDDYMDVDHYALLQTHFDNVDIPPGIEAPIPWLADYDLGLKKTNSEWLSPWSHTQIDANNSPVTDSSQPSLSLEPTNPETQGPSAGSSSLQIKMDAIVKHPSGIELSSPLVLSQTSLSKKKSNASQCRRRKLKLAFGMGSSKSNLFLGPSETKKKPNIFYASANHVFADNLEAKKLPHVGEALHWGQFGNPKKAAGSNSSYHSNFVGPSFFPGVEFVNDLWMKNNFHFQPLPSYTANSVFHDSFVPNPLHAPPEELFDNFWVHNSAGDGNNGTTAKSTVVTISDEVRDEILRKFQNFKQFDTIEDTSDHYFVHVNSSMKQHSKNWAKRIQEEWKSLEKDLPDSILVRVYESRIDLLRAVIIGAEGTPYHDGLFFFDVFFPSGYPNVPPSNSRDIFQCSKSTTALGGFGSTQIYIIVAKFALVCLTPGLAIRMRSGFQVLVSIQGLILNTKPYFNEPGYARLSGSQDGEMRSLQYNEDTFILSLRTMVYTIRRPPKNFEDFVVGHFCSRAHDILVACKAYMDGAQVGCLVKGGVQDVDQGDKSCSKQFKESLPEYVDMLVREFTQIGAKDCDKVLPPSTAAKIPLGEMPVAATIS